jgi:folate-binding protein YgfZ
MTTIQVRDLPLGHAHLGFLLSPQGKTKSTFYLARLASSEFLAAVVTGAEGSEPATQKFLEEIDRFKFAETFEIQPVAQGFFQTWIIGSPETESQSTLCQFSPERIDFFVSSSLWNVPLRIVATPSSDLPEMIAKNPTRTLVTPAQVLLERILHLSPELGRELHEDVNPLELGLNSGIAENKGCYPGQEVIEKIISLGSPAKSLALIRGNLTPKDTAPTAGTELSLNSSVVGVLSSVARESETSWVGLSTLRKNATQVGQELSLAPGLRAQVAKTRSHSLSNPQKE